MLESLMTTLIIDAIEERDVATADVVGAYLNANMDDFVLVKLTGDEVDLLCSLNKSYNEFVTVEK